jgi:hypothetical protein
MVGYKDQKVLLNIQLSGGEDNLYPQATIIKSDGSVYGVFDLSHTINGMYTNFIDPVPVGVYVISFKVYTDSNHTIESYPYADSVGEYLTIESGETNTEELIVLSKNDNKLDPNENTLIIYENDGVTPAVVYDLFDMNGAPAVNNVYYRRKRP